MLGKMLCMGLLNCYKQSFRLFDDALGYFVRIGQLMS